MKPTHALSDLGQSLWLDHITRDLLESGTLECYVGQLSVTGLTSNPTILDAAISRSAAYDRGGDLLGDPGERDPALLARALSGRRDAGARPQRLLFASTGTKDPAAPDVLYVRELAPPNTVDTMPEKTGFTRDPRRKRRRPRPAGFPCEAAAF